MSRPFGVVHGVAQYHIPADEGAIVARASWYQASLLNRRTGAIRRIYNYDFQPHVEHFLAFTHWLRLRERTRHGEATQ